MIFFVDYTLISYKKRKNPFGTYNMLTNHGLWKTLFYTNNDRPNLIAFLFTFDKNSFRLGRYQVKLEWGKGNKSCAEWLDFSGIEPIIK